MGHKLIKIYLYSIVLLVLGLIISVSNSISSSLAYADDSSAVDSFNLSLPVSCTIGSSGGTHTQPVINNQYYGNLGGTPTTFTMFCNDKNGFIVYAIGASDNTEGITNLIGSTGQNIPTGVYDPNNIDTTTSSWSFKLGNTDGTVAISSGYNDNLFHAIPATWTEIARKQEGTINSTTGSQITATYDAYISGVQAAGNYTGQVKYVVMHPSSSTQPVTLAEAFKNAGKQKVYATDPLTGESGEFYTMQDMTMAICNAANVFGAASELELVDTRDSKLYWVTKLHTDKNDDTVGQCWMTENLDLDLETTPTNVAALTSNNTNLKLYGSYGYNTANGYTCTNSIDPSIATSADCSGVNEVITWTPETNTSITGNWGSSYNDPRSYDKSLYAPNGTMNGHGYAGNYYNWTAAIASNYSGNYNASTQATQVAANSICPKGWRLPNARAMTGGYEFSKLLYAYGVTKDDKNTNGYAGTASAGYAKMSDGPLYFVRSGHIYNTGSSSATNAGSEGNYWSSAAYNGYYDYGLSFNNNSIEPAKYNGSGYDKSGGFSIRCLVE